MSDDIAIQVRGLGKKYTIGGPQEKYNTIRDAIANSVKAPFRKLSRKSVDKSTNDFWALKDVSFDVREGEVIGIIGRNGAGKSTLLKIISQITTPTEGEVDIFGRVGSLLEVGTGFHPELTGRENIFLSGSILGMRKREIEQKFDEMVQFAEIEKFIDTPVKRYSSGMYVRLAFAVAAHMETEILVVDEVLAVGDSEFQKKCLGKMGDVAAKEGRTVLFVSHNMAAVQQLCSYALLLEEGHLVYSGEVTPVVEHYIRGSTNSVNNGVFDLSSRRNKYNEGLPVIKKLIIMGNDDIPRNTFLTGEPIKIGIFVDGLSMYKGSEVGVVFRSEYDQNVTGTATWMCNTQIEKPRTQKEWIFLDIESLTLTPGRWNLYVVASIHSAGLYLDIINEGVSLYVEGSDFYGSGQLITKEYGFFCLKFKYKIVPISEPCGEF